LSLGLMLPPHAGKPRSSVRMQAFQWHLIRRLRTAGGIPANVARDARFSRDVVSAVLADCPSLVRWRLCPRCSASNRFRDRKCRACGETMNPKQSTGLAEIALVLRDRLADVQPKELIRIGRHTAGELGLPIGSKATRVAVYSGPVVAESAKAFAPLFSGGKPVEFLVFAGASAELPAAAFACHSIALVADVPSVATLRLRG
jgi:ribosomal protein L40E